VVLVLDPGPVLVPRQLVRLYDCIVRVCMSPSLCSPGFFGTDEMGRFVLVMLD